jgi:DNA-binding transcriptional MocR family regulator
MNQPTPLRLYLKLHLDILDAPAWRATSAAGRLLYIALRRRHNSKHNNNGDIFISQREAAKELKISRPTVAKSFQELEHYGFIVMTSPGCLGVEGRGRAPHWRLTEVETASAPPSMDFKKWNGTRFQRSRKKSSRTRPLGVPRKLANQASF